MNLSAIPKRTMLGRLLRMTLRLLPSGAVVPILQGKLRGKRWIAGSSLHGCWLGSYEYEKRVLFERTVTAGEIVYDVGAHVGFYSLLASILVGAGGRVIAFEPSPRNLRYLREHLRLNRTRNVTIVEAVVSDGAGLARFDAGSDSHLGHISPEGLLEVRSVTLDGLVSSGELPPPDCLKIDVEGAELQVLEGARQLLASTHPDLFLATHYDLVHEQCCMLLQSLGYDLHLVGSIEAGRFRELHAGRRPVAARPGPGPVPAVRV